MRKGSSRRRSWAGLGLWALLLGALGGADVTVRNDFECRDLGNPRPKCDEAGDIYCGIVGVENPADCNQAFVDSKVCFTGTNSDDLPPRICLPKEGAECQEHEGGAQCGAKREGWCGRKVQGDPESPCVCKVPIPVEPEENLNVNVCNAGS